jgi:purine-binding chemotaxis protein CheW
VTGKPDHHPPRTTAAPLAGGDTAHWVVFALDAGRYALPLASVERIVRAARVTPLPRAPAIVLGAIDVEGQVLPVFNLRRRFGLPERPVSPADQFLIARTAQRPVVLVVDVALGVIERPAGDLIESIHLAPDLAHVRGVIALADGLVLIQDLERFLSPAEANALDRAIDDEEATRAD